MNDPPAASVPDPGSADDGWAAVPRAFRAGAALPLAWRELFGPLRSGAVDDLVVVGQIGQSLDGRVATLGGRLDYINGLASLAHLHRLRALVDAVVVGIGTVLADDPRLTVRHVAGPHPARVVIDPRGRLPARARLLADDGAPRLIVTGERGRAPLPPGVETLALPTNNGHIAPAMILAALAERGFRRVLIEGGAETMSRFLAARCLDRLHILVAPIILGSGRQACSLPPILCTEQAIRPHVRAYPLADEVLFDCDLSAHRRPIGHATKSM